MTKNRELFFFICVLLFAFALRVWGIDWGQPNVHYERTYAPFGMINDQTPLHPDEFLFVALPFKMVMTDDLNPHFFENPSFLINLNALLNKLTGATDGFMLAQREGFTDRHIAPFSAYVVGRLLSALGGMFAVASTMALLRHWIDGYSALVMGILVSISLPLVQHAHYSTTSSLATGFAMVCLFFCYVALIKHERPWGWIWLILAGVCAGLATGSRYNVGVVSLVVLCTGFFLLFTRFSWRRLFLVGLGWLAFPVSFLLTTPYAIFDSAKFIQDLQYISSQYLGSGTTLHTTNPLLGLGMLWGYALLFGIGLVATIYVLVGIGYGLRAKWHPTHIMLGLIFLYGVIYAVLVTRTVRPVGADQLMLPMIPILAIFAGIGFGKIVNLVGAKLNKKYTATSIALIRMCLIVLLLVVPLYHTLMFLSQVNALDNRQIAQKWVYEHIPQGSKVRLLGNNNVPLDPQDYAVEHIFGLSQDVDWTKLSPSDYLIISDASELLRQKSGLFVTENLPANAKLLLQVYRPLVFGYDWAVYTTSYWHNPTLRVYCLNEIACNATIP